MKKDNRLYGVYESEEGYLSLFFTNEKDQDTTICYIQPYTDKDVEELEYIAETMNGK